MYAQAAQEAEASEEASADDDVVDAEFTEKE